MKNRKQYLVLRYDLYYSRNILLLQFIKTYMLFRMLLTSYTPSGRDHRESIFGRLKQAIRTRKTFSRCLVRSWRAEGTCTWARACVCYSASLR